jgi:hypothetical protein
MKKQFKNFALSLPAKSYFSGDIIVTDPCYFMPDDIWHELIDAWFIGNTPTEFADNGVIEFANGAKVLYSSTAYGDGEYPVFTSSGKMVHNDRTGVDAGMIAVVSVEDLDKIQTSYGYHNGKKFSTLDHWYPRIDGFDGEVSADGKGNFVGDLEVPTATSSDEEEYTDEDGDEDNLDSYGEDEEGNINY